MPTFTEKHIEGLGALEEAIDPHNAVGLWWAYALLASKFDSLHRGQHESFGKKRQRQDQEQNWQRAAQEHAPRISPHLGNFALALSDLSRRYDTPLLAVHDYQPDPILEGVRHAPGLPVAFMTAPYPCNSYTYILEDGSDRVIGKLGASSIPQIIYPADR